MSEVPLYTHSVGATRPVACPVRPETLQGYLAYKKTHPPKTLPYAYA